MMKYRVSPFAEVIIGEPADKYKPDQVSGYGYMGRMFTSDAHREHYSIVDARDTAQWLNERANGYPTPFTLSIDNLKG